MSSSKESRINRSIWGLTRISICLVPSCLNLPDLFHASLKRAQLFFMLERLFPLLLYDLWFGLIDKLGISELFLRTRYFVGNLSDLLRQSCTFLVKIEKILD